MSLSKVLNQINPRKLFLIDGLGALLSAGMLGLILTSFETSFGMPKDVLYVLAALAGIFSVYSLLCYMISIADRSPFLKVIAVVNLLYCGLTLILVIYFFSQIKVLGMVYFLLEIAIVVTLAVIEWRLAKAG